MRNSRQREVVLEDLRSVSTHPTADEVFAMSKERIPNISLATVYRNLEFLADKGVVTRLEATNGKRRYDGDISHHNHSRCSVCGRLYDLDSSESSQVDDASSFLCAMSGVDDVLIELRRVCGDCGESVSR